MGNGSKNSVGTEVLNYKNMIKHILERYAEVVLRALKDN